VPWGNVAMNRVNKKVGCMGPVITASTIHLAKLNRTALNCHFGCLRPASALAQACWTSLGVVAGRRSKAQIFALRSCPNTAPPCWPFPLPPPPVSASRCHHRP